MDTALLRALARPVVRKLKRVAQGRSGLMRSTENSKTRFSSPPDREAFRPREWAVIQKYRTPRAVQQFLRKLKYNREEKGETLRTFRGVLRHGEVHCLEAALAAAAILEQHGYPPLLVDLESQDNLDHVLFLFRHRGRWGTVARSRDAGLQGTQARLQKPVATGLELCGPIRGRLGADHGLRCFRLTNAQEVRLAIFRKKRLGPRARAHSVAAQKTEDFQPALPENARSLPRFPQEVSRPAGPLLSQPSSVDVAAVAISTL